MIDASAVKDFMEHTLFATVRIFLHGVQEDHYDHVNPLLCS